VFHPHAVARFDERGESLRDQVRVISMTQKGPGTRYDPYPATSIDPAAVIGKIVTTDYIVDDLRRNIGLLWTLHGQSVGLVGEAYQELKSLADSMAKTPALRGRVDAEFLVGEISGWIQSSFEGGVNGLAEYVAKRCRDVIKEHEIWVPLFQVHASEPFAVGEVQFQKMTPEVMDRFFTKPDPPPIPDAARIRLARLRSELQNHLAACVKVTAERETAKRIARAKAETATALLRFLSPANRILDIQSYCLPLGRERIENPTELFIQNGEIREISRGTIERGPVFWDIDPERARLPGLLDLLDALASEHSGDFRHHLYDALLIYSRNSTASETTDKLVFVLVSLESMLLKDANEPISQNIGERMAFLVGDTVEERKAVIQNVGTNYRIRSSFIHHGQSAEESTVIERFCDYAWQCFNALLHQIDAFPTKAALIEALEHRKLSGA
jgi:hypothetical protein